MIIAWFSCGATSAVACKLALSMYSDVRIIYIETNSSHNDNHRFIADCEHWFGRKIEIWSSNKYHDVADVIAKKKFINSPHGAPCTDELKKKVRYQIEQECKSWDGQVWGFDWCAKEINRAIRFKQQYPNTKPLFPLIERHITKQDAIGILWRAGIEIPVMYRLGYHNNNCIGCVKGGIGYWNKIRRDFPDVFWRMAKLEREIGATCLKDRDGLIWLDSLNPNRGDQGKPISVECGIVCEIEFSEMIDKKTKSILDGSLNINLI